MNESSKRPALSLLASVMLVLLPAAGLTACGSSTPGDSSEVAEVSQQVITADSLAGLKPGEHLVVDLRKQGVAYTFNFSKAPIDFSRITLIPQNGDAQPMDKWLSTSKANGRDLLAALDHTFRLAPSAQSFGDLSTAEVAQLQSTGSMVKKIDASSLSSETRASLPETRSALGCYTVYYYECHLVPPYAAVYECELVDVGYECDGEP